MDKDITDMIEKLLDSGKIDSRLRFEIKSFVGKCEVENLDDEFIPIQVSTRVELPNPREELPGYLSSIGKIHKLYARYSSLPGLENKEYLVSIRWDG